MKKQTSEKNDEGSDDVKKEAPDIKVKVEEPEPVKPPADLFKAIFLDSDSDESDAEDEEEKEVEKAPEEPVNRPGNNIAVNSQPAGTKPWEEKEGNVLRNKQPARGIFANIDLDSLNRRKPLEKKAETSEKEKAEVKTAKGSTGDISVINQTVRTVLGIRNEKADSSSEDEFGPKLPESMIQTSIVISSESSEDGWIDKDKLKKKKKSKDKKKHKDRKSGKKKKKSYSPSRSKSRSRERDHDDTHRHGKKKKKKSKY